jgi:hypothetical protein
MTSSQNPDMDDRSPEVEIEVDPPESNDPTDLFNMDYHSTNWQSTLQDSYDRVVIWFNSIPSSGKLLVLAVGGLLGLTLLKTFLQLLSSLITLLILGIIFYLIYRFWIAPKSN